ncbi:MAG TPA: hypothetical protein VGL58_12910 [Caulobacteraceae bacterium]|jgi:hypothetical protein
MGLGRRLLRARWITVAILGVGGCLCLTLNWPGHFSYDSVVQLAEGRSGSYSGDHPLVMSWLLGLADAARPGAALFVIFDVALVWGTLIALAMAAPGGRLAAAIAVCFAATPQLMLYPAIVWKDVLFAGAMAGGFACLGWAALRWERPAWRWALLAKGAVLLSLAALTRQNGAVVLPIAAVTLGWIAARRGGRRFAYGLGLLAATAVLTLAADAALAARLDPDAGGGAAQQWRMLQTWDLVGALKRHPRLPLPALDADPAFETLLRTRAAAAWSPVRVDTLLTALGDESDAENALIGPAWRQLILRHPLAYLEARASAFAWITTTPDPNACGVIFTGVDGPAEEMSETTLTPRRSPLDAALARYGLAFLGTPVISHLAWGALALALLAWLAPRRQGADIAVAGMLAAALAFAASFAVISISCDYRYLYALDLTAMGAALYAAGGARSIGT